MDVARQLDQCDLVARIASTREEWTAAFRLLYRQYIKMGYVAPNDQRIAYREVFGTATSRTLVAARSNSQIVGTLALIGDSDFGFDIEATYGPEVARLRDQGRELAEATAMAICPSPDLPSQAAFLYLTRLMSHYAYHHGYDDILMVVRPKHFRTYQRYFGATKLGPSRQYFPAGNVLVDGVRIKMDLQLQTVHPALQPFFSDLDATAAHVNRSQMPEDEHCEFCQITGIQPAMVGVRPTLLALPAAA